MNEQAAKKWWTSAGCVGSLLLIVMLGATCSVGRAQEQDIVEDVVVAGKVEFKQYCAVCHGSGGTGGSALQRQNFLKVTPADLTRLSKRHGGEFPFWNVYNVIDGRVEIRGHGTRAMPIWADAFQAEEGQRLGAETRAVGRILSLVFYLQSIQKK